MLGEGSEGGPGGIRPLTANTGRGHRLCSQPKEVGQGGDAGHSGKRETVFNDNPPKVPTAFGMKFKLLPVPTRPPMMQPRHPWSHLSPPHSLAITSNGGQSPPAPSSASRPLHRQLSLSHLSKSSTWTKAELPSPLPSPSLPLLLPSLLPLSQRILLPPTSPELTAESGVPPQHGSQSSLYLSLYWKNWVPTRAAALGL